MEFIVGAVVVILLLLLLGVSWGAISSFIVGIIGLLIFLLFIFFAVFAVRLCLSEKKKGKFTRIGRPEKLKYDVAFYETDGEEYPNIFPCEVNMLRKRLYNPEKEVYIRLDGKKTMVFDKNAALTIILGLAASALFVVFSVVFMIIMY